MRRQDDERPIGDRPGDFRNLSFRHCTVISHRAPGSNGRDCCYFLWMRTEALRPDIHIHGDALSAELFVELFNRPWMIVQHGHGCIVVTRQRVRLPPNKSHILPSPAGILVYPTHPTFIVHFFHKIPRMPQSATPKHEHQRMSPRAQRLGHSVEGEDSIHLIP